MILLTIYTSSWCIISVEAAESCSMNRRTRQTKENNGAKTSEIRKEQVELAMRRHRQKMTEEQKRKKKNRRKEKKTVKGIREEKNRD
ncbi:hypothetical protein evm_010175 [Chilo suppressalis]|nr:hypothetical protein evm_010175 [Chilo suppressalis]